MCPIKRTTRLKQPHCRGVGRRRLLQFVCLIKIKMLLIILLGLFTTLTSVSGDCDVGTQGTKVVNFPKALGTWYVLLHTANVNDNNFKCVAITLGLPEENISLVTLEAYDIGAGSYVTIYGNATNFTNTTADIFYEQSSFWSGRYYVIATDYDNYIILKLCSSGTNQLYVYVAYRSKSPDKATLRHVRNELRKNDIDERQLVVWPTDSCQ